MSKRQSSNYFKAITAMAVAASAVVVVAPAAPEASSFSDVKSTHQFYDAIQSLSERGIINGFQDGTFKPGQNLTRGQAAKIIAGVLQLDTNNVINPNFKDIPTSHQYYGAIAALKQAGIIDGYEDGTFRQGANIQRNHVAKIIANALNLKAENVDALPFTDVRTDYKEAIAALFENKVTTGKTATLFDGSSNVTRGQMAAFITRAEAVKNQTPQPTQSVTFKVEDYTASGIAINGSTYSFHSSISSIFTEKNKTALTGAVITATIENGVLTKIDNVAINKSGTAESRVVFDSTATIGSLTINADYVSVKNVSLTGNATVTSAVMTEVEFEDAKITGDLIVDNQVVGSTASIINKFANDGKADPKIKLKNSRAGKVHVKRNDVSIESDVVIPEITIAATVTLISLDGTVTKMTVESSTKLDVQGNANIGQLLLTTAAELALKIKGFVTTLTVNNSNAQITLGARLEITELSIPAGSTVAKIIKNYHAIASQIVKVIVGNVPGTPTPNPGTPNTGGGSDTSNPPINDNKLNVKTLTELNDALKTAKKGETIKLLASITGDINLTSLINLDFNGHTLTGNVTINEPAATGTYSLAPTGGTGTITGNLIINAPNVNINIDGLTVEGETVIN
ncbi:S-layer homology domain-containing protein [Solibacillus sp. FSL K6-4121]|uniref:S-layer homology domain-containing protein n=1 Tax=Solibacillus sp. FSL K6-4121 TaxID=2921505 RepID=UPI0030F871EC